MRWIHHLRAVSAAAVLMSPSFAQAQSQSIPQDTVLTCNRAMRQVTVRKSPVNIYVSTGEWTQVVFPQKISGYLPEVPKGIQIHSIKFRNRLFFRVTNNFYAGMVYVIGSDGASYSVRVLARKDCADSTVTLVSNTQQKSTSNRSDPYVPKVGMSLIDEMYVGHLPSGYSRNIVKGTPKQRLVFRQGSVFGYVNQIWSGQGDTGFIIRLVNHGRTPVKINISGINYDAPVMQKIFGRVTGVSMDPPTMLLGPAPRFASQQTHPVNQGLLYISARKKSNG